MSANIQVGVGVADDPYEILGVERGASEDEIKRAFRKKAKSAHPDREAGDNAQMVALNRAKDILSDPDKRAKFDETGSTDKAPTIEEMARMSLVKMFDNLLADDVDLDPFANVVDKLRLAVKRAMVEYEVEIKTLDKYTAKLDKKANKIKCKAEVNLWASTIADRKKRYEAMRAGAVQKIEVAKMGLTLLDEYECEVQAPPPPPAKQDTASAFNPYQDPKRSGTLFRNIFGDY